ncbi:MAG TPA: hypothetical protein DDY17_08795 [Syntrophaceae bacterium]|nr:hypothetical protein [Syntrophaceae bacterium]
MLGEASQVTVCGSTFLFRPVSCNLLLLGKTILKMEFFDGETTRSQSRRRAESADGDFHMPQINMDVTFSFSQTENVICRRSQISVKAVSIWNSQCMV